MPNTRPRAYTPEEVRDMLLDQIRVLSKYWADLPNKSPQERCDGVAFSILATLDGSSMNLPAMDLKVACAPEDREYYRSQGQNWFKRGQILSFALHEHFYKKN